MVFRRHAPVGLQLGLLVPKKYNYSSTSAAPRAMTLLVETPAANRRIRVIHFSLWAEKLEAADAFLQRLPALDLTNKISNPNDAALRQMARLDCDWHGESTRAFAALQHAQIEFLPAKVTGPVGLLELAKSTKPAGEEWWLVFDGQTPQKLGSALEKLLPLLERVGLKFAWYAFDEVSRTTSIFKALAPHLRLLIHDEFPLDPAGRAMLHRQCVTVHRSWVANVLPFSSTFNEAPEEKIIFIGSKLGLTEHRQRQIDFLQTTFKDRFLAIHDHSVPVAERHQLNRFKVSVCPEGRKFTTAAMGMTHTDRPFWSGCLGLVPVSEDSRNGGRLENLAEQRLIFRYAHADLSDLKAACERALAASAPERQKIYNHFNRFETVGTVFAAALHSAI